MRYDVTRCLLSLLFLVVFAILSSGSDLMDIMYPDKKKPPPDNIISLGDGTYRVESFYIGGKPALWEEGPRDARGYWNGRVKMINPADGHMFHTVEYKNGQRHGWSVTYYLGGAIKETEYYVNGRKAVPPAPYPSPGVLEYKNLRDSPASPTSSYQRLEQTTPWFIDEMEILFGISKENLDDFLAEIEARIPAANPQNEDEFIGAFNTALQDIAKLQQYDITSEAYNLIRYREAQARLKRLELRLAIFDRILGKATSTFSALQKFYPLYLEGLVAKGATLTEIKAYLDDIDSRMDALGPFNMNDPLLAEAIDDRISKVLDDMSEVPDYQIGEMIFRPAPGANNGEDDGSETKGKDAYAWTCGDAYSGSSTEVVGHPRSTCNQCNTKGYIQFNIDTLPAAVKNVYLGVKHNAHTQSCITMCNANFYFYPVLSPWNEMTIGSGAMPAEGQAVLGPVNIAFPNDIGSKEYKITDIYTSWKTGKTPNNGLAIYSPDVGCVNGAVMFTFHSSDDPTPANRPYLKIIYFKPVFLAFYMPTLYAYFWSDPVFQAVKDSYGTGDSTVYTSPDGNWGGKMPSYTTIQAAVDAAGNGYEVKVKEGDYPENVFMWESKQIGLAGGYDDTFASAPSFSKIRYLEISKGTIWCKGVVIGPQ